MRRNQNTNAIEEKETTSTVPITVCREFRVDEGELKPGQP